MGQLPDNNSINPFGNTASVIPTPRTASDTFKTALKNRVLQFACYGGRTSRRRPFDLYSIQVVCDVTDMPPIKGEPINEQESVAMGKEPYKSNDGQIFKLSWKVNGDNIYHLAAIVGKDTSPEDDPDYGVLAPNSFNVKGDFGVLGCIFIQSGNNQKHLRSTEVLTQVRVKCSETPGSSDSYTVEFESIGEHFKSLNGTMYVYENFVDKNDGLIVNPFAPDGIETVFKVGNGNKSLLGASTPAGRGLPLTPVRTDLKPSGIASKDVQRGDYWFIEVAVDGEPLLPSDIVSYNRATGELTLKTAPADGSCLSLVYALPTGYQDFNEKAAYFPKDIRMYNNEYYICSVANGPGVWNPTDWTLHPLSTHLVSSEYRPHNYGVDMGTIEAPEVPTCHMNPWTILSYYI